MNKHIANARAKATELYSKRDEYKAKVEPHAKQISGFFNRHIDKVLMSGLVVVEIWQGESLDNIEEASQVSAAVDYHDYTQR
jgi:S-methylmethionine-dependent homocysteine/selenocysteine methylase